MAACIALLGAAMLSPAASAQTESLEILEIDTYHKTASPGKKASFSWTVRNSDTNNISFTAYVTISESGGAWNVTDSGTTFVIPPLEARTFRLTMTAPASMRDGTKNVTVEFDIRQGGSTVVHALKYAELKIETPKVIEEKKVLGMWGNPLPKPLNNDAGVFLCDILLWLLFACLWIFIGEPIAKVATAKTETKLDDIILDIIRIPIITLIFFYGLVSSLDDLERWLPFIVIDIAGRVYGIVLVFVLLYVGYRLFKDIVIYYGKELSKKTETNIDDIVIPVVEKLGVVVIGLVALGYFLGYMNVDLTMFVAGGVVISMVIAFAAQDTLSNFFAGIFLLTDRPFKEGDTIILADGDWCEVRKIGLRTTRLFRFSDATMVSIPNNKLINDKVANFTDPKDRGTVTGTFGAAYGSDPEKVKKIISDVVAKNEQIIQDDESIKPIVRFEKLGDSAIEFFVLVRIKDRAQRFAVKDYLNTNIYKRFNEENIDIPFPTQTVYLRQEKA